MLEIPSVVTLYLRHRKVVFIPENVNHGDVKRVTLGFSSCFCEAKRNVVDGLLRTFCMIHSITSATPRHDAIVEIQPGRDLT